MSIQWPVAQYREIQKRRGETAFLSNDEDPDVDFISLKSGVLWLSFNSVALNCDFLSMRGEVKYRWQVEVAGHPISLRISPSFQILGDIDNLIEPDITRE